MLKAPLRLILVLTTLNGLPLPAMAAGNDPDDSEEQRWCGPLYRSGEPAVERENERPPMELCKSADDASPFPSDESLSPSTINMPDYELVLSIESWGAIALLFAQATTAAPPQLVRLPTP